MTTTTSSNHQVNSQANIQANSQANYQANSRTNSQADFQANSQANYQTSSQENYQANSQDNYPVNTQDNYQTNPASNSQAKTVLGIDVGGSTTKIVGYKNGRCVGMMQVEAGDQITSAYGAFGKFIACHRLRISDIGPIMLTGVGASHLSAGMYDIPTHRVNEFRAIGLGGLALAGLSEAVIVSMGTGTALVKATADGITHLGGSGVGGGTLLSLCQRFAGTGSFESITALAAQGDLSRVNLTLADISPENIGSMPSFTTASNFGKLSDAATGADIVLGVVNMIFEIIGMMAVFATRNDKVRDVVLTGALTTISQAAQVFDTLSDLFPVQFHIPPDAIFATAVGAALAHETQKISQ